MTGSFFIDSGFHRSLSFGVIACYTDSQKLYQNRFVHRLCGYAFFHASFPQIGTIFFRAKGYRIILYQCSLFVILFSFYSRSKILGKFDKDTQASVRLVLYWCLIAFSFAEDGMSLKNFLFMPNRCAILKEFK